MNQDIFKGTWKEIVGNLKETWGKLTDDDWTEVEGNQEKIYGKLQKHYGYTKEKAMDEIKNFQQKANHKL